MKPTRAVLLKSPSSSSRIVHPDRMRKWRQKKNPHAFYKQTRDSGSERAAHVGFLGEYGVWGRQRSGKAIC